VRENSGRGRHAIHVVVLQCGDPSATGAGRPGYRFINEYPTNQYRLTDPALQLVVRHPPGTLATGDGARLGDRVATADTVGPYAEYCVAPADIVTSVPDLVTSDIAAAAILKGMTAHKAAPVAPGRRRGGARLSR
jgi:hypothetical protein